MGGRSGGGSRSGMGTAKSLPATVSKKETKENLDILSRYVVRPLAMNSEMSEYYYYESGHNTTVAKYVTSQEIKQGLFKMIDGTSSFSAYKKGALKKQIETTLSKGGKEKVVGW